MKPNNPSEPILKEEKQFIAEEILRTLQKIIMNNNRIQELNEKIENLLKNMVVRKTT